MEFIIAVACVAAYAFCARKAYDFSLELFTSTSDRVVYLRAIYTALWPISMTLSILYIVAAGLVAALKGDDYAENGEGVRDAS